MRDVDADVTHRIRTGWRGNGDRIVGFFVTNGGAHEAEGKAL